MKEWKEDMGVGVERKRRVSGPGKQADGWRTSNDQTKRKGRGNLKYRKIL